jgi:hypothetical protein
MLHFRHYWDFKYWKFSAIVLLLCLIMITLAMIPWNVWGDELYSYTDKEGTMVISNMVPQENINFNTWSSNSRPDSTFTDKDDTIAESKISPQKNIKSKTRLGIAYNDLTSEERLHWGRDNALIDQKKDRYGKRRRIKDDDNFTAGKYEVNIKKIASNLYQDLSTLIIIKTQDCIELAGNDGSSLDWSGVSGELFFEDTNKTCTVKKVYK